MTSELKKAIDEYLESRYSYCKNEDGTYNYEMYADYDDELDSKTAIEILEAANPMEKFYYKLEESWFDARMDYEDELVKEVKYYLESNYGELGLPQFVECDDEITDYLRDTVYYEYPEDHYLDQEYYVNIYVDTGDGNYDFVLNSVYPHYNGRQGERIDGKASIVWLAKQQGYTKTELQNHLKKGNDSKDPKGFLESLYVELINMGSHMTMLAFLTKMSLRDLIKLNELIKLQEQDGRKYDTTEIADCGYIVIDKNAETGLYDAWDGGGSVFEIQLEKDVRLPIRFIRSALPDGGDGYSISEVYGMCGSCWRDVVSVIKEPKKKRVKE